MAKKSPEPPTPKQLGLMMKNIMESGYIDKKTMYKMSFIKGILGGLGGVIGATIIVGLLLWALSLTKDIPWIGRVTENLRNTVQTDNE